MTITIKDSDKKGSPLGGRGTHTNLTAGAELTDLTLSKSFDESSSTFESEAGQ